MENYTEEELIVKTDEIAKEIAAVFAKHAPLPVKCFLIALAVSLEYTALSSKKDGGPSFEDCMNEAIGIIQKRIARHNENNA